MSSTPNSTTPLTIDERMEIGAKLAFGANPLQSFFPYLIGMWADAILLGCLIGLAVEWRRYVYRSERRVVRFLVCFLMLVSCAISCHVLASQLYLFAEGFGVYKNFLNPSWHKYSWMFNGLSRVPAASFFTHRSWLLSNKSIYIPIVMVPLLLTTLAFSFAAFATAVSIPIKMDSLERLFVIIFVSTELATDVINTFTIALGLYRSRTGWKGTDRIIVRLFVILAETQLPPTLGGLGFLICFVAFPNSRAIYLFAGIAKIHVVCLLIVLCSRVKMTLVEDTQLSYPMTVSQPPNVAVETYVHSEANTQDIKLQPAHSTINSRGDMRTVNGRSLGQHRRESYRNLDSDTSLNVTVDDLNEDLRERV